MAQEGKISLIGLANWNSELFSEMNWPDPFDGDTPALDTGDFLYELMMQTAELEVIICLSRALQLHNRYLKRMNLYHP